MAIIRHCYYFPLLLLTRGNKWKHHHRRIGEYIGSLGEAEFNGSSGTQGKTKTVLQICLPSFPIHLYLLYISSPRRRDRSSPPVSTLSPEVNFFFPKPLVHSPPLVRIVGWNHIRLRHQGVFPVVCDDQLCLPNVLAFADQSPACPDLF